MIKYVSYEMFDIETGERIYHKEMALPEYGFERNVINESQRVFDSFIRGCYADRSLRLVIDVPKEKHFEFKQTNLDVY